VSDEGHKMIILSSSINGQHQLISFSLGFFFFATTNVFYKHTVTTARANILLMS